MLFPYRSFLLAITVFSVNDKCSIVKCESKESDRILNITKISIIYRRKLK